MKTTQVLLLFLSAALSSPLPAQQTTPKWDVEIPVPITDGTPPPPIPKPDPIDFKVLSSRTTRQEVTKAPEISGLPPVTGKINVTVQLVEDPKLPEPPPSIPAPPATDPAVIARRAEMRKNYRATRHVFLSATVHDHKRTLLEIYPSGQLNNVITAWSNIDFNHISNFTSYRVKDATDGTFQNISLIMGIGNTATQRWSALAAKRGLKYQAPEIPTMPDLAVGGPSFILVKGEADSPTMDTLEQIHDLYRKEGTKMEAAYHVRLQAHEERKAYLLAHPEKPKDVSIQFWKQDAPQESIQNGGGQ